MWFRTVMIVIQVLGVMTAATNIGKPKAPETPGGVAAHAALAALIIWGIVTYWKV